jgi:hypothetical protein
MIAVSHAKLARFLSRGFSMQITFATRIGWKDPILASIRSICSIGP